jgi:RNA polymerase sigma-70 factor (ECF subfamily)
MTDEELAAEVQQAASGDLLAFDILVNRHQSSVTANCRYMTRSTDDAEDLAQEVFVKAYFGLARFEGRSRFKTWLRRIKINQCLKYIEKRAGKRFVNFEDPAIDDSPEMSINPTAESALVARGQLERVAEVLDSMADTLRVPLVMRELDGLSYDEISEMLGIGLSAVKMRIKRAREAFRRTFEERGGGVGAGQPAATDRPGDGAATR